MTIFALSNSIFRPAMRVILSISNAFPAQVVTSVDGVVPADNNYIVGTIVRLDIPTGFGMTQANQLTGAITQIVNSSTFLVDIDTRLFDPFVMPANWPYSQQQAQVVPMAEINSILTAAVQNILR